MVRLILSALNRKSVGLHDAAYLLAFFALASQLLALVRDRILAGLFGAGVILDTYYASFRIPDILFALIASSVSISVLIPFLSTRLSENKESAKKFIHDVFTVFLAIISVFSFVIFLLMPYLVKMIFPGFTDPVIIANIVFLSRIMLLSPIFLGISSLMSSVTQLNDKFFVYALSPLLYNIGIIIGALFFFPFFGIPGLAIGVVLGAIFHLLIQMPAAVSSGFTLKFSKNIDWKSLKSVLITSLPRTLALSTQQITILVLISIASVISIGSISVFNLAYNLQSVPLSIIGVSYSSAAFPALSRLFMGGEKERFFEHIAAAMRHIVFWSIPATILFVVLRAQIIRTAFGSGEFGWEATRLTAAILALFVISTIAQSLIALFVRAYYASGNTRKPLLINLLSSAIIILSAFLFKSLFENSGFIRYFLESLLNVSDLTGTAVLVLPLAYSLGTIINIVLFWISFQADFRSFGLGIYRSIFHILAASIIAGYVAYRFLDVFDEIFNLNTLIGIFSQGLFSGLIGLSLGFVVLKLIGNRELEEINESIHRKFWKAKIIIPEQEDL